MPKFKDAWREFAADFDNMSDEDIEFETRRAENERDEAESWLEAVASWEEAGRPRSAVKPGKTTE